MWNYAYCYANGLGTQRDSTRAYLWASRAIENNNYAGYTILGNMYEEGKTISRDLSTAMYYYEQGSNNNIVQCQLALGRIYLSNELGQKDIEKSIHFYSLAANNGSTYAMRMLGFINYDPSYEIVDYEQAAYWLQKAFESGDYKDAYTLTALYKKLNKHSSVIKVYEKLGTLGDPTVYNRLAYMFANGEGVQQNYDKAMNYIERAIKLAPTDMNYLDSKGEILLIFGDIKGARKIWKQILKQSPLFYEKPQEGWSESVLNKYMVENSK